MIKSNTLNILQKDEIVYITFPSLEKTGCVKCGFTTRFGGVSKGIYSSMNMSFSRGDNPDDVKENYHRFCDVLGVTVESCVLSKQTHTTNVINVYASDRGKGIIVPRDWDDVDGMITNEKNVTLVTQFADCVPLLFCDPVRKVIASSHAGWRGTVNQIGKVTVEKMIHDYECCASDICVAIGPSIKQCCFEVDAPVYEEFTKLPFYIDDYVKFMPNDKYNIDLQGINKKILNGAGILDKNITVSDLCTKCNADVFFSHRATGGQRGNLAAFISLK